MNIIKQTILPSIDLENQKGHKELDINLLSSRQGDIIYLSYIWGKIFVNFQFFKAFLFQGIWGTLARKLVFLCSLHMVKNEKIYLAQYTFNLMKILTPPTWYKGVSYFPTFGSLSSVIKFLGLLPNFKFILWSLPLALAIFKIFRSKLVLSHCCHLACIKCADFTYFIPNCILMDEGMTDSRKDDTLKVKKFTSFNWNIVDNLGQKYKIN